MSDSETSNRIDDFAQRLLDRAKTRMETIKGAPVRAPLQSSARNESLEEDEEEPNSITEFTKAYIPLREVQTTNIKDIPDEHDDEIEEPKYDMVSLESESGRGGRRSRLKSLARRIDEWEDDMTHYVPPTSRFNVSPPKNSPRLSRPSAQLFPPPTIISYGSPSIQGSNTANASPKQVRFDTGPPSSLKSTSQNKSDGKGALPGPAELLRETPTLHDPNSAPSKNSESQGRVQGQLPPKSTPAAANSSRTVKPSVPNFSVPSSSAVPLQRKWEVKGKKVELNTTLAGSSSLSVAERAKLFEQKSNGNVPKPLKVPSAGSGRVFGAAKNKTIVPLGILPRSADPNSSNAGKSRRISIAIPRGKVESSRRLFEEGLSTQREAEEEEEEEEVAEEMEESGSAGQGQVWIPLCTTEVTAIEAVDSPVIASNAEQMEQDQEDSISFSALNSHENTVEEKHVPPPRESPSRYRSRKSRSRSASPQKCLPQSTTPKRAASPSFRQGRSPSPEKMYPGSGDIKRIKVNDPKPGHMYPSLTDIEATTDAETEVEADVDTQGEESDHTFCASVSSTGSSLGTQIERMAKANAVPEVYSPIREEPQPIEVKSVARTPRRAHYRPTEEFSASLVCREIDAMIDSALDGQSFSMDTIMEDASPLESSSPLYPRERRGGAGAAPSTPLLHSVSFFRKQEEQMYVTPKKAVAEQSEPVDSEPQLKETPYSDPQAVRTETINEQIKKLDEELEGQVKSIAQVSKALNLCKSTIEFSDSMENVECEKVLLLACQKRNAILNEMTRLRTEGVLSQKACFSASKNDLGPSCQGNLTISEIGVELKESFIRNKIISGDNIYHFLLLFKQKHQVEASSLVSIGNGRNNAKVLDSNNCLHFPNTFRLDKLEPDFKVELEVFVLQTQREFLPHETKYHIKKKESKTMTPKKLKGDSMFSRGVHQSPAGPDAVRSPNFVICGRLTVNISTLGKRGRAWTLDGVRVDAPVEGSVAFKLQCSAEGGDEMVGFLTLFDDISGLGAWHRRWAKLTANNLSFWMYPEDEQEGKFPVDQIFLRNCVTTRVCPVNRDVCARANTLLLVTTHEAQEGDKNSLIASCHGNRTAVRHLLCADTRDDRDSWCAHLNRALANLRAWDPQAASPDDTFF